MNYFSLSFLLLIFNYNLFANEIEEIIIQENKLEDSISEDIVSDKEISDSISISVDDLLQNLNSITTTGGPRSSSEAPQVRGLDSKKIYIYIDGIKQSFRTDHSTMIPLNTSILKSATVYKSPNANPSKTSLGGGVEFASKDPKDFFKGKFKRGVEFSQVSQRENNLNASAFTYFDSISFAEYYIHSNYIDADDLKLNDGNTLNNSSFRDHFLNTRWVFKDNLKLSIKSFKRKDTVPLNPSLNPPSNIFSLNGKNETNQYSIKVENKKNYLYLNKFSQSKVRNSDDAKETRQVQTIGLGHQKSLSRNSIIGIEVLNDKLSGNRNGEKISSYPNGTSTISSVYIDNRKTISRWSFNLNNRIDHYSLEANNGERADRNISYISNTLSLKNQVNRSLVLGLDLSEGFNAPRIQDLYIDGLHHNGDGFFIRDNYFIPNPSLKAETSFNKELSLLYTRQLFSNADLFEFSIQFYENLIDNYILLEKIDKSVFDSEDGTTQSVNMNRAKVTGHDLSAKYSLNNHQLDLNYSQVRGKNGKNENWIATMPADYYDLSYSYIVSDTWRFGYGVVWTQEQNRVNTDTIERTEATGEYLLHNAFVHKKITKGRFDGLSVFAKLENISDKEYRKHGSNINEKGQDLKLKVNYIYYF